MRRTLMSLAAATLIATGTAITIPPAVAGADPVDEIIASLLEAGSSDSNTLPIPGLSSPNGVVGIETTVVDSKNVAGVKLGPNLFGMSSGKFVPLIKYNAYTSGGGTNRANNCQMEIQVTGPQNSVVRKTANCNSQYYTTQITTAGRYTASVIDRVSARVGRVAFTVE